MTDAVTNPFVQLAPDHKRELLRLAREAISSYLRLHCISAYATAVPQLRQHAGVFVTLWHIQPLPTSDPDDRLRGCVGRVTCSWPLYYTVQRMAVSAATADPRFPPLTLLELGSLNIEVSILSPLLPVSDLNEIVIGTHGLVIEGSGRRGLLLPKVASSRGWTCEQFLEAVYWKAGLPDRAWPGLATLYSFTAVSFTESDFPT